MRINQNIMALNAYRNLSMNEGTLSKSLEKLSSGTRINRAGDDASGFVISQGLRSQVGGLNQATRNAQDGISVVQTAEGALNEVHTMLGRMRDLAVQASNTGASDVNARTAAQKEVTELSTEIDRLQATTRFGTTALLDGTYGTTPATDTGVGQAVVAADLTVTAGDVAGIQIGTASASTVVNLTAKVYADANALAAGVQSDIRAALVTDHRSADAAGLTVSANTINTGGVITYSLSLRSTTAVSGDSAVFTTTSAGGLMTSLAVVGNETAAAGTGGVFQVGSNNLETINVSIANQDTATLFGGTTLDLVGAAGAAITKIDTAIGSVSDTRAQLGAKQNRFESIISNLQVATENLSSSESRIRDTDYASEMVKFTRGQILNQAATSMLGQANKLPQSVLSLLQG
jgi:flagellin